MSPSAGAAVQRSRGRRFELSPGCFDSDGLTAHNPEDADAVLVLSALNSSLWPASLAFRRSVSVTVCWKSMGGLGDQTERFYDIRDSK